MNSHTLPTFPHFHTSTPPHPLFAPHFIHTPRHPNEIPRFHRDTTHIPHTPSRFPTRTHARSETRSRYPIPLMLTGGKGLKGHSYIGRRNRFLAASSAAPRNLAPPYSMTKKSTCSRHSEIICCIQHYHYSGRSPRLASCCTRLVGDEGNYNHNFYQIR